MSDKPCGPSGFGPVEIERLDAAVVAATDITFGRGGETDLLLDLYRPPGQPNQPLPAVIFIHGGGWAGGAKEDYRELAARVASRGYLCASINYRLSHQAPFPAALEDCKCAARWVRAHAHECCADADHIAALGASAGAHLAAMLALTPGRFEGEGGWLDSSSAAQCAVCYCGPFDLTAQFIPAVVEVADQFLGPLASRDRGAAARQASPISHVARGAPPFLLVHGDQDDLVPIEQSQRFAQALREAGVPAQFIRVRHANHGYEPTDAPTTAPDSEAILAAVIGFLDTHLKPVI